MDLNEIKNDIEKIINTLDDIKPGTESNSQENLDSESNIELSQTNLSKMLKQTSSENQVTEKDLENCKCLQQFLTENEASLVDHPKFNVAKLEVNENQLELEESTEKDASVKISSESVKMAEESDSSKTTVSSLIPERDSLASEMTTFQTNSRGESETTEKSMESRLSENSSNSIQSEIVEEEDKNQEEINEKTPRNSSKSEKTKNSEITAEVEDSIEKIESANILEATQNESSLHSSSTSPTQVSKVFSETKSESNDVESEFEETKSDLNKLRPSTRSVTYAQNLESLRDPESFRESEQLTEESESTLYRKSVTSRDSRRTIYSEADSRISSIITSAKQSTLTSEIDASDAPDSARTSNETERQSEAQRNSVQTKKSVELEDEDAHIEPSPSKNANSDSESGIADDGIDDNFSDISHATHVDEQNLFDFDQSEQRNSKSNEKPEMDVETEVYETSQSMMESNKNDTSNRSQSSLANVGPSVAKESAHESVKNSELKSDDLETNVDDGFESKIQESVENEVGNQALTRESEKAEESLERNQNFKQSEIKYELDSFLGVEEEVNSNAESDNQSKRSTQKPFSDDSFHFQNYSHLEEPVAFSQLPQKLTKENSKSLIFTATGNEAEILEKLEIDASKMAEEVVSEIVDTVEKELSKVTVILPEIDDEVKPKESSEADLDLKPSMKSKESSKFFQLESFHNNSEVQPKIEDDQKESIKNVSSVDEIESSVVIKGVKKISVAQESEVGDQTESKSISIVDSVELCECTCHDESCQQSHAEFETVGILKKSSTKTDRKSSQRTTNVHSLPQSQRTSTNESDSSSKRPTNVESMQVLSSARATNVLSSTAQSSPRPTTTESNRSSPTSQLSTTYNPPSQRQTEVESLRLSTPRVTETARSTIGSRIQTANESAYELNTESLDLSSQRTTHVESARTTALSGATSVSNKGKMSCSHSSENCACNCHESEETIEKLNDTIPEPICLSSNVLRGSIASGRIVVQTNLGEISLCDCAKERIFGGKKSFELPRVVGYMMKSESADAPDVFHPISKNASDLIRVPVSEDLTKIEENEPTFESKKASTNRESSKRSTSVAIESQIERESQRGATVESPRVSIKSQKPSIKSVMSDRTFKIDQVPELNFDHEIQLKEINEIPCTRAEVSNIGSRSGYQVPSQKASIKSEKSSSLKKSTVSAKSTLASSSTNPLIIDESSDAQVSRKTVDKDESKRETITSLEKMASKLQTNDDNEFKVESHPVDQIGTLHMTTDFSHHGSTQSANSTLEQQSSMSNNVVKKPSRINKCLKRVSNIFTSKKQN